MKIEVLVSPDPCCEGAGERVSDMVDRLKSEFPDISLNIVDAVENPESLARHHLFTVPAVVVNDTHVLEGLPKEEDLRKAIETELKVG